MRLAHSLPLLLVAACGDTGTTSASASATDSATGSTGAPDPTTGTPTTTGDTPTGGSGGATDSGTTTSPFTSTTATTSDTADTGDTGGSTMSLQTEPLPDTTTTAPDSTSTTPDETTSSETTTGTTGTTGDEPCACPDDIEVPLDDGIFVLGDTGDLWKYFPEDNTFTLLGELGCDLQPPTFSMAVDRLGYAWVEYPSGALRKIAVTDVTDCTDPGYPIGQQGILNFGMAFVSNSAFDKCDRIYGSEYRGRRILAP
jgi:hypothetical protein